MFTKCGEEVFSCDVRGVAENSGLCIFFLLVQGIFCDAQTECSVSRPGYIEERFAATCLTDHD